METAIYTGTSMLNTVINMSGYKTGILVTRGFEDIISQGRGKQTFIGAQWSEITHMQYRRHRTPLVPSQLSRGVTERIDMFGTPVIPMYEDEVREGARSLIADEEVEAIAIIFLQSFVNPIHENRAEEICREVMKEVGREVVLEVSNKVAPTTREISRANATVVQAYASDPARKQLYRIEEEVQKVGYPHSLKTVLGYGGITNIRYPRLFEAAMSGPVGGLMGAKYLASVIGEENIVCSDVGGTSFDAGTITAGVLPIDREPGFQDMYVNVPMLGITSIGAGTGTYIRLDPQTQRIKLGPDSAGGTPGPVFMEAGNQIPTINDANLLLGVLNEHNYLGGKVHVSKEASLEAFEREIARLARKSVTKIVKKEADHVDVTSENLDDFLGVRKFRYGLAEEESQIGVVTGLAYTSVGGDLLQIEALRLPGKGRMKTTGKLGDVMKESIEAASSYVRSIAPQIGVKPPRFDKWDIHVHVPEGATPKDGPSAGIAMVTSIVSVLTQIPVRKDIAMTGEVTLRGHVLPIGGLKEKLLAALRGGITKVLIPKENEKDLAEIPDNVKEGLTIVPVETVQQVLEHALVRKPEPIEWDEEAEEEAAAARAAMNPTAGAPGAIAH